MNQKNIFSVISAVLILQGIAFFFMGDQLMTSSFPAVDATGHDALVHLFQVPAALSILLGLITYVVRSNPDVLWAYTIGVLILVGVTSKHMFMDHINVPIFAFIIQALILLSCAYLWLGAKKS